MVGRNTSILYPVSVAVAASFLAVARSLPNSIFSFRVVTLIWNPKQPRSREGPPILAPFCLHPRFASPRTWILLLVADDRVVLWLGKISRARYVARNALRGNRNGRDTKVFPTDPCIVYSGTVSLVAFSLPCHKLPVEGEPFRRQVVCILASRPAHRGKTFSRCSRCDCSCSSSPIRMRVFSLPRNLARTLFLHGRPPIRTRDHTLPPLARSSR